MWHEEENEKGCKHSTMKMVELFASAESFASSKSIVTFQGDQNILSSSAILSLYFCFSDASNNQS